MLRTVSSAFILFYLLAIFFCFIVSLLVGNVGIAVLMVIYLIPSVVLTCILLLVAHFLKLRFKYSYPLIFLISYFMLMYIYTLFSGDSLWTTIVNIHSNTIFLLVSLPIVLSGIIVYLIYNIESRNLKGS